MVAFSIRSLLFLLWCLPAMGQTNRYMVFFKDKTGSPHTINAPETFLSARAIDRRAFSSLPATVDDIPVTPSYVTQVKMAAGSVKTFFTSRWMNGVLIEAAEADIPVVQGLSAVASVELVAPGTKLLGGRMKGRDLSMTSATSQSETVQLTMLGIDQMHKDGYAGEGIWISVLDSGFPGVETLPAFQKVRDEGRIKMTQDFVTNSGNVYQFYQHGTNVFSTISAHIDGSFTGGAEKANYLLFATEDANTEYRIEEYNWLFAAEKADSAGTDIIQSSLGYNTFDDPSMDYLLSDLDGNHTVVARAASFARDRGIIVVVSAGNEGDLPWHYISSPADSEGILSTAAVDIYGAKTSFSSFGPSSDGRVKPDVAALGLNVRAIMADGTIGLMSGTSLAAPLVTSLTAGLRQAFPEKKPADLVEAIKQSASQSNQPDNERGYGIPHYQAVKNYLQNVALVSWVTVYPNPSTSTCYLAFQSIPEGNIDLTIYDMVGRQRFSATGAINWENNPTAFSVEQLPAGVYVLYVKSANRVQSLRFVKL